MAAVARARGPCTAGVRRARRGRAVMARADGRQAKKGKPRGPVSPAQVVEVCRVLHLAGRPLTRAEIAKEWAARGNSGFLSEAQRAYKQHKEAHDPTWLEGKGERWGKSAQAEAWQWWVN